VAVYVYGGWFDLFSKDAFKLYANLTTPKKLLMVDSPHSSGKNPNLVQLYITEQLRWFDYWLKGVENGIMEEQPIALQKIGDPEILNFTQTWPLTNQVTLKAYFHEGKSSSVNSVNDGILDMKKPDLKDGLDKYKADFSTTSGNATRWDDAAIKKFAYPNMAPNDEKGLTYTTTTPLQRDLTICVHPVITCWLSSTASNLDLYAYLEDIDSNGYSKYITEGCIRASFRKIDQAPYSNLGLPYHRCYREDQKEIKPNEIIELKFDLLPIYYEFKRGHKIRVTFTGADKDNSNSHKVFAEPEIVIYRNTNYLSNISLPLFQANQ